MARRAIRILSIAAWTLAAWPMASSHAESAGVTLDKYGWWSASQTLPADPTGGLLPPIEVPASPNAPDDGIYIESSADGSVLALGGVSFYTGGGVDSVLTLEVTEGGSGEDTTLAACPADGGWDAAQNGRWDKRPTYDPTTCTVLGQAFATSVTFTIPAAAQAAGSGYLTLAIVPAEGSGAFSVGFDPPTSASLATTPASVAAAEPTDTVTPSFDTGSASLGQPTFSAPPAAAVDVPAATVGSDGDTSRPAAPVAAAPLIADTDEQAAKVTAAVVLAAIAVGLWFLGSRPQRAPRLLGSVGGPGQVEEVLVRAQITAAKPRGLGRFARHRDAPPTAI